MTAVTLYNDETDIYGVSDCIEFAPDKNGDYIGKDGKRYTITLVEYKPTRPKDGEISLPDAVQVFAQKLCADKVFARYAESARRNLLDSAVFICAESGGILAALARV